MGWMSMSGTAADSSPYGVDLVETGGEYFLEGHAWSSNVGWTQFGNLTGCPVSDATYGCDARLNQTTGEIEGWARICSATDGGSMVMNYDVEEAGSFDPTTYNASYVYMGGHIMSDDGTKLFMMARDGATRELIIEFPLNTAFDVASVNVGGAIESDGIDPTTSFTQDFLGLKITSDGTTAGKRLFVTRDSSPGIRWYDLNTPWSVAGGMTFRGEVLFDTTYADNPWDITFSTDGLTMIVSDSDFGAGTVRHLQSYTLSSPYNPNTITNLNSPVQPDPTLFDSPDISGMLTGFAFNPAGDRMFVEASIGGDFVEYTLSTPWDITTLVAEDAGFVFDHTNRQLDFNSTGDRMYSYSPSGGVVYQYDLDVPWNLWDTGTGGYPAGDCTSMATHALAGGWDGWISLNCSNDGNCATSEYHWEVNSGTISGYAWGDDVVGWVYADDITVGGLTAPTASIGVRTLGSSDPFTTASPYVLAPGEEIEIEWGSTDASQCLSTSGSNFSTGSSISGTDSTVTEPAVGTSETFSVLCSGAGGSTAGSITVENPVRSIEIWTEPIIANLNETVTINWDISGHDPASCTITGPDGFSLTLTTSTGSAASGPIAGETDLVLECNANGVNPTMDDTVRVRINPTPLES